MEENNCKCVQTTNLPTLNIKSQLNMNIDSNTNIKQVLNVEACLIDAVIEPLSNKALVKGTIGIKVVYVDMDNMFNTLSDSINFSETITSDNITTNCQININNCQFVADFENNDKMLNILIEGTVDCFCNSNSNLNLFNPASENFITKKSTLQTCDCLQQINKTTSFDYDCKIDAKINKVLSYDSKIVIEDSKCYDGYVLISGQIINTILCEIETDGNNTIKTTNNSTPFKCEIEANLSDNDCVADMCAYINLNSTQITTEIGDNYTKFNFEYSIVSSGFVYKNTNIDIIDDMYSLENFIEPVKNSYSLCKKMPYFKSTENVDTEITLADELNVDEIVGMINTSSNITQYSVKENSIMIEGVISGNLLYLDENREIKHLPTQLPYAINIKQDLKDEVCGLHLSVVPVACKCKIKRGNTLMVDYELCVSGSAYIKQQANLIDNVKLGKNLDYGDIAFQICIAHNNETCWDLCKRLHVTKEQLLESNPDIPGTYMGGEKVIIYR